MASGAVGLNFEDTDHARHPALTPVDAQAERIAGIKAAADVVLNARIDVHLRGGATADALARARAYRDAGADCVYPIGVVDEDDDRARSWTIGMPVNILLRPGAPPVARLAELGVARDQPRPPPPRGDARRAARSGVSRLDTRS